MSHNLIGNGVTRDTVETVREAVEEHKREVVSTRNLTVEGVRSQNVGKALAVLEVEGHLELYINSGRCRKYVRPSSPLAGGEGE